VLAPHPSAAGRFDAFWIAGGRVVDWGPLPADTDELMERTRFALGASQVGGLGGWLPADELVEARIIGAWLAARDDVPVLELARGVDPSAVSALVGQLGERTQPRL